MRHAWAIVAAAVLAGGCHTMRFELADQDTTEVVYDRKSFFFWGLTPTREVVVTDFSPEGVAAIREETRFSDGFFSVITLGIYQPRSSWYYCLDQRSNQ